MARLSPNDIHHLCNLSYDEIMQVDPSELRTALFLAVEQTMDDLRGLGINIDLLEQEGKGSLLYHRVSQLHTLKVKIEDLSSS